MFASSSTPNILSHFYHSPSGHPQADPDPDSSLAAVDAMEMGTQGFPTEYQANAYGELPGDSVQPELEPWHAYFFLFFLDYRAQEEALVNFRARSGG